MKKAKFKYPKSRSVIDWIIGLSCTALGALVIHKALTKIETLNPILPSYTHHHSEDLPSSSSSTSRSKFAEEVVVPKILGPLQGTRFISGPSEDQDLSLRWEELPDYLTPEVEIRRLEDATFFYDLHPTQSGVALSLPDGSYQWRVRSKNTHDIYSEWSHSSTFTIEESLRGAQPVAVLPHLDQQEEANLDPIIHQGRQKKRPLRRIHALHPKEPDMETTQPSADNAQIRQKYERISEAARRRILEFDQY